MPFAEPPDRRPMPPMIAAGPIGGLARTAALLALAVIAGTLAGCGTVNEKLAVGMGDYIPQWAGGLPADAPPRPGSAKYDAFQKELERRRQMPAAQREQLEKSEAPAMEPVH